MVRKHVARSGSSAGKWVVCQAQKSCRNGGAHVNASTLKETKQFIKRTYNLSIPVPEIEPGMVKAYIVSRDAQKQPAAVTSLPPTLDNNGFRPMNEPRKQFLEGTTEHAEYIESTQNFLNSVASPDFSLDEWHELQEMDEAEYAKNDPFADLSTLDERASLEFYSEQGYSEIRSHLSPVIFFGKDAGKPKPPQSEKHAARMNHVVKQLDSALSKNGPSAENQLLYRGFFVHYRVPDEQINAWVDKLFPVGGVFSQTNYMSTTVDPQKAAHFSRRGTTPENKAIIFEILSKNGSPIGEGISQFQQESEVLLRRDAKFRVVEVAKNTPFEVVGDSGTVFKENRTVIRLVDLN